jgi:hypothetical protein
MRRKKEGTVLHPDVAANIRAIFVHDGAAVTVDEATRLLGWPLATMDEAIKWRAVEIDAGSERDPRISRRQLLEHAFDQWSLADIKAALPVPQWKALVKHCGTRYGKLAVCDRDTLRAAAERPTLAAVASAALLRPEAEAKLQRDARRARKANVLVPKQFKRHRRTDGVREFTLTAFALRFRDFVPMLRIRGRWLARLGFKPGMRVYLVAQPGAFLITTTDPAKRRGELGASPAGALSAAAPLALPAPSSGLARVAASAE